MEKYAAQPPGTMSCAQLRYQLREEELLECFLCLDSPKEGRAKWINEGILTVLAAVFVLLYAFRPAAIHYALLAVLLIFTLLAIHFYPALRRARRARSAFRKGGAYSLSLWAGGWIQGEGTPRLRLGEAGDRLYESALTFTFSLGNSHRFCLPKRVLTPVQLDELYPLLRERGLKKIDISNRERRI